MEHHPIQVNLPKESLPNRSVPNLSELNDLNSEDICMVGETGHRLLGKDDAIARLMLPISQYQIRRAYWSRAALSIATLCLVTFLMAIVQIHIGNYYIPGSLPLHDVVHELVGPEQVPKNSMVNFMCLTILAMTVTTVIFFTNWHMRFTIAMRFSWLLAICYIFRMIAIFVTTVPTTYFGCVPPKANGVRSLFVHAIRMILNVEWGCADMILSGHSMMVVNCLMTWTLYFFRPWYCWSLMLMYGSFVLVCIVTSHFHYTIDVFLGAIVTVAVYQTYHVLLDIMAQRYVMYGTFTPHHVGHEKNSFMARIFFFTPVFHVISWMEAFPIRLAIGVQHYRSFSQRRSREAHLKTEEKPMLLIASDAVHLAYAGDGRIDTSAVSEAWWFIKEALRCFGMNGKEELI